MAEDVLSSLDYFSDCACGVMGFERLEVGVVTSPATYQGASSLGWLTALRHQKWSMRPVFFSCMCLRCLQRNRRIIMLLL
jgi:hypothetical protein